MEVAAALLDASRKISDKEVHSSSGNLSVGSNTSLASSIGATDKVNAPTGNRTPSSSWLNNPWGGERKRTMSDCVCSSDKISTMAWLGGWPLVTKNNEKNETAKIPVLAHQISGNTAQSQGLTQDKRVRRTSCKGVESAMAGGLGKFWYDS